MLKHSRGLGEFEQAVLLSIMRLKTAAYGTSIRKDLESRLDKSVSVGALYMTLDRLEKKGLVSADTYRGGEIRGNKPKKLFKVNGAGVSALDETRERIAQIWSDSPLPLRG